MAKVKFIISLCVCPPRTAPLSLTTNENIIVLATFGTNSHAVAKLFAKTFAVFGKYLIGETEGEKDLKFGPTVLVTDIG